MDINTRAQLILALSLEIFSVLLSFATVYFCTFLKTFEIASLAIKKRMFRDLFLIKCRTFDNGTIEYAKPVNMQNPICKTRELFLRKTSSQMFHWVLNLYLILLLKFLPYLVCCILAWAISWLQDHILLLTKITSLLLSFILQRI